MKNKRGQFDFPIITLVIVIVGLILVAPTVLKIVRGTLTPFADSLGNSTVAGAGTASNSVNYVLGVYVNMWDGAILFCFLIAVILLFISAFLIDANPFFMVLYILLMFLTIFFSPNILQAVDRIYESNAFAEEVALLSSIDFIRLNFGLIITVLGVLTMIIIYAKVRFFPSK